jgi:hypothetical protein
MPDPTTPQPLTPGQKEHWNRFVDYLERNGYKGNPKLDNRNMAFGQNLLERFNQSDPKNAISYQDIARVQHEFQQTRAQTIDAYRKNPKAFEGVKNEDEIMANISPVDGWLGSKTSSHKFPVAILATDIQGKRDTTNFGTDINAMEKTAQNFKPQGK